MNRVNLTLTVFWMALATIPAGCAPQPASAPLSGEMQGMSGMHSQSMGGMNMPAMMQHCAEMRQQTAQGMRLTPEMQQMMAHCDAANQTGAPAPDATRSR